MIRAILRVELSNGRFQEFVLDKAIADRVVLDWTASFDSKEPFEITHQGVGPKAVTYYHPGGIIAMTLTYSGKG